MADNDDIKLDHIDESKLEGVRDFITTELNERVLPFIYEHNLMFAPQSDIYSEYLAISNAADKLVRTPGVTTGNAASDQAINASVAELYNRTKKLILAVIEEQKKSKSPIGTPTTITKKG